MANRLRSQIADAMKQPKAEVDYSEGTKQEHCGLCEYYHNHTCDKVRGTINPDMWCKLFEKEY